MSRPTWDQTWMEVARRIAKRSLCDRDQVGAVIVPVGNGDGFVASYNGPPAGYPVEGTCSNWCDRAGASRTENCVPLLQRDYSDCPSAHAEQNAITRADFSKIKGGTIYVTSAVCITCAKSVANSGVARVIMRSDPSHTHRSPEASIKFMLASGLHVEVWPSGLRAVPVHVKKG